MTTFTYTTTTTGGKVNSEGSVEDILDNYYFTVEPELSEGEIRFAATDKPNGAFGVYYSADQVQECEEEFFEQLSEYLESSITVKCVETQGEGEPAAYKWQVGPDGRVSMTEL